MKFKIKTNLWTGILFGLLAIFLWVTMESQVRIPAYDSGAPSPRILPTIYIAIILACSIILIIQSLVLKKETVVEFDWSVERPMIVLVLALCAYTALIVFAGYLVASIVMFPLVLFYVGERKPIAYIVCVAAAVGIYFLFKYLFNISLPACPFL